MKMRPSGSTAADAPARICVMLPAADHMPLDACGAPAFSSRSVDNKQANTQAAYFMVRSIRSRWMYKHR
jgi:hypothetical protein